LAVANIGRSTVTLITVGAVSASLGANRSIAAIGAVSAVSSSSKGKLASTAVLAVLDSGLVRLGSNTLLTVKAILTDLVTGSGIGTLSAFIASRGVNAFSRLEASDASITNWAILAYSTTAKLARGAVTTVR
jgi:hypothetical protein